MTSELRVVVDSNIFISALLIRKSKPDSVIRAWYADEFVLLSSTKQIQELKAVLARPHYITRYGLSQNHITEFLDDIKNYAELITLNESVSVSVRDPKDEMILATALVGNADYVVTGDKDLLVLAGNKVLGQLAIVTPYEFLRILHRIN